MLEIIIDSGLG